MTMFIMCYFSCDQPETETYDVGFPVGCHNNESHGNGIGRRTVQVLNLTGGIYEYGLGAEKEDLCRREGKGRRCYLRERIVSISCRESYLVPIPLVPGRF